MQHTVPQVGWHPQSADTQSGGGGGGLRLFVYMPVACYKGMVSSCSVLVNEEDIMC